MSLCKYKDLFGKPGQGIHSYRIFNIAIVDVIATVIGAFVLSYFMKKNFWVVLFVLFVLGIILHHIFCVRTTVDKFLFP
jgi:hypothetical protein